MQQVQTTFGDRDDVHNRMHNLGFGLLAVLFYGLGLVMTFYFTAALVLFELIYVFVIRRFEYKQALLRKPVFKFTSHFVLSIGVLLLIVSMSQFFLGNLFIR